LRSFGRKCWELLLGQLQAEITAKRVFGIVDRFSIRRKGLDVIPFETYALIFGVPLFAVVFSVALSIVGKRIFGSSESDENMGSCE